MHLYTALSTLASKAVYNSNPQQGTHQTLVWVITLRWLDQWHPTLALNAILPYVCWVLILPAHKGMEGWVNPGQVELGVDIEPRTPHMKVCCSTNWAILANARLYTWCMMVIGYVNHISLGLLVYVCSLC